MTTDTALAASLGAMTNVVHGFIYFAPEAVQEYDAIGLAAEQHYFASRAAALGPVPAEVVVATFFNFNPTLVHAAIPAAWSAADPDVIQAARMRAAGLALARFCPDVDVDQVEETSALAGAMAAALGVEGKPLAAANRAVREPDDPWARLWQRVTVLREWRGDVHVAVLTAAPLDAVEALLLHAATEQVPKAALLATRQWPDEAWSAGLERLRQRGLLEADEKFTDAGRTFRDEIEHRTDVVCQAMVDSVGASDARRLVDLLKPIRRGLIDGGAFAGMGR